MYRCRKCRKQVDLKPEDPVRCPFCGYKILYKERPKVVKRVHAE
jgi:DNA-directed RNA polymerase subunit P